MVTEIAPVFAAFVGETELMSVVADASRVAVINIIIITTNNTLLL